MKQNLSDPVSTPIHTIKFGTAITLLAERLTDRASISDKRDFYSSVRRPDRLRWPPSLIPNAYRGSLPGVKRPGQDADQSRPCSTKGENVSNHTYIP